MIFRLRSIGIKAGLSDSTSGYSCSDGR